MTSIPASRSARAMILAPRSCPSSPGLATTTRILRVDAGAAMAAILGVRYHHEAAAPDCGAVIPTRPRAFAGPHHPAVNAGLQPPPALVLPPPPQREPRAARPGAQHLAPLVEQLDVVVARVLDGSPPEHRRLADPRPRRGREQTRTRHHGDRPARGVAGLVLGLEQVLVPPAVPHRPVDEPRAGPAIQHRVSVATPAG